MALSITAANVVAQAGATKRQGIAGTTITAGMPVYKDSADNLYKKSGAAVAEGQCDGIALNGAANGQPLTIQTDGDVSLGAVANEGYVAIVGGTAGTIDSATTLDDGYGFVSLLGVFIDTSILRLGINDSGASYTV